MSHNLKEIIEEIIEEQKVYVAESKTITCSNCDRPLLDVVIIKEDPNSKRTYIATCPFCGDKSFPNKFVGVSRIAPPEKMFIDSYEMKDEIHLVKMGTKCNK